MISVLPLFGLFFCALAQTEFSLPPVIQWENTAFEGFILLTGKNEHLLGTRGQLRYMVTPSGRVANRGTFTFSDGSTPLDSLTLYQQDLIQIFDVEDGNCTEVFNEPPSCASWTNSNNKWTQACTQRLSDKIANWTTVCSLTDSNRLNILSYTVSYKGKPLASLDIYSTVQSPSPAPASDFVPSKSCVPSSNSPFDPASCIGPALNLATKFKPGARATLLSQYNFVAESRDCTTFTGCTDWNPYTTALRPSGSGTIWLKVTSNSIVPTLVDKDAKPSSNPVYNLGSDCKSTDKNGGFDCGSYHDSEDGRTVYLQLGGQYLQMKGSLLQNCGRFVGSAKGPTTNGAWTEYRVGFLTNY